MINSTVIHFVRHGEVYNPQAVYYGRLPAFPLSKLGRQQAQAAADFLCQYRLAAVFSSPLDRAIETSEIISQPHNGLTWQVSELLNEAYTPFDGQPMSMVAARDWDVYTGNKQPYEQPSDVLRRAQQFVAEIRQQYMGQYVVATTHGDVIAFMMLWVKEIPATPQEKLRLYQGYLAQASVTTFTYQTASEHEVPSIEYVAPHKEPLPGQ
jgi:broad specificity phosphatase PhoE